MEKSLVVSSSSDSEKEVEEIVEVKGKDKEEIKLTKECLSKAIISLAKNEEFLQLIFDEIKKNH